MKPLSDKGIHEDLLEVPGATGGLPDGLRKPSGLRSPVANPALNPEFYEEGDEESYDTMESAPVEDEGPPGKEVKANEVTREP